MFLVIYEWSVKPGKEALFEEAWRRGTVAITLTYGTYGSRLGRTSDGRFVGFAEWPDKARWRAAMAQGMVHGDVGARAMLAEAVLEGGGPVLSAEILQDLLERTGASE